jgi:hypothetical protein
MLREAMSRLDLNLAGLVIRRFSSLRLTGAATSNMAFAGTNLWFKRPYIVDHGTFSSQSYFSLQSTRCFGLWVITRSICALGESPLSPSPNSRHHTSHRGATYSY